MRSFEAKMYRGRVLVGQQQQRDHRWSLDVGFSVVLILRQVREGYCRSPVQNPGKLQQV